MAGQLHAKGARMRDYSKGRSGFDRALVAVAATFLTVSATAVLIAPVLIEPALAQADPARKSAADLAIDAAIPRPEPANVPPPTASDFKMDTTASVPDPAKAMDKAPENKAPETAVIAKPAAIHRKTRRKNCARACSIATALLKFGSGIGLLFMPFIYSLCVKSAR